MSSTLKHEGYVQSEEQLKATWEGGESVIRHAKMPHRAEESVIQTWEPGGTPILEVPHM